MPSINTLKKLTFDAPDLSEVINYFYQLSEQDLISHSSQLLSKTSIQANPELQAVLSSIKNTCEQFLKQEVVILDYKLFTIPAEHFYHGLFIVADLLPLVFFYFSDIKTGIFSYTEAEETKMFRFTLAIGENGLPRVH
jgi:hypothetical protein